MLTGIPIELVRLTEPKTTVRYEVEENGKGLVPQEVELFAFVYRPSDEPKIAKRILDWLPEGYVIDFYRSNDLESTSIDGVVYRLTRHGESWQLSDDHKDHGIAEVKESIALWWLKHCLPSNTGPYPRSIEIHEQMEGEWTSDLPSDMITNLVQEEIIKAISC